MVDVADEQRWRFGSGEVPRVTMQALESSAVAAVGYDPTSRRLYVNYVGEAPTYLYYDVAETDWRALLDASSIGIFVNTQIKPFYRCAQLGHRLRTATLG